jgi:hypothetical protein
MSRTGHHDSVRDSMRGVRKATPRASQLATAALIVIGCVGSILAITAITRSGIGWDANADTGASIQIRSLQPGVSLQGAYDAVLYTSEFYGILVQYLADAAHSFVSGNPSFQPPALLETYHWQAGVTVAFAVVGAAALGFAVGAALQSWLAGSFAWACLMTLPLYLGMSHVDFKDMPVAAGLTMLSSGLILSRTLSPQWRAMLLCLPLSAAGAAMCLGTRAGSWPLLLAVATGSITLYLIADIRAGQPRRIIAPITASVSAVAAAILILWLINPFARIDLFAWLYDSFATARAYPGEWHILTAGIDVVSTARPWWYVPAWLLAQLPILTTVALVGGLLATVGAVGGAAWSVGRFKLVALSPLLVQGFALPVLIVVSGANLYDGIRHLLFMIPSLVAVAAIGIATLERRRWASTGPARLAPAAVAIVVVGASLFASVRWYPYSYAFINPIAGWDKSRPVWELDYWGVTALEGVERLRAIGADPIAAAPVPFTSSMVGSISLDEVHRQGTYRYGLYYFNRGEGRLPKVHCSVSVTIKRDGLTLGEGGICTG